MPLITLTTDFGVRDPYVGEVKGVIYSHCPSAAMVDITHEIKPYDCLLAGHTLNKVHRSFPEGSIHLCAVGDAKRGIIVKYRGQLFVAPDNGVLTPFFKKKRIQVLALKRKTKNDFFQARDILAPAAGRLAFGRKPETLAQPVSCFTTLSQAKPAWQGRKKEVKGQAMVIDRFGNVETNIPAVMLIKFKNPEVVWGKQVITRFYKNYHAMPPKQPGFIVNCYGYVELTLKHEALASIWEIMPGERIIVREKYNNVSI